MSSEILITFPGGKRVDAQAGNFTLHTDQPQALGGNDSAPDPFTMFLASMGACAGLYVIGFCAARGIPQDGLRIVERIDKDDAGKLVAVTFEIQVPSSFPGHYHDAVARAAAACKVKKTIADPPKMIFKTTVRDELPR